MSKSLGKAFEACFKECWSKSFPDSFLFRLQDQVSGYKTVSQNPCDFIGYVYPNLYLIECKSHEGASFPLSNLTQYDKLRSKTGISGVRVGVVLWLIDKDRVDYIPLSTIEKLKADNIKSINPEKLENLGYRIINIPSKKKRVFLDSDYSILKTLNDGD